MSITRNPYDDSGKIACGPGGEPEHFRSGAVRQRTLELRVGLSVFVASVILILGIMWFQGFSVGRETYDVHVVFPMVAGIDKGDALTVNGVEMGEVKEVLLRQRDVFVTLKLDAGVRIPDDSKVILQTVGIMGERGVTILLGESGVFLEPGATIAGTYDPGISEALGSMGRLMEDLQMLTREIHEIADALTEKESLAVTMRNLAEITEDMRSIIDSNAPELEKGISSFRSSANRMDGLLSRNSSRLDSVIAQVDEMSRDLPVLVRKIGDVTDALASVIKRLENDDNTIGSLMQDRELLDKLEGAIGNLDELIIDIKANPKRYFTVEIF